MTTKEIDYNVTTYEIPSLMSSTIIKFLYLVKNKALQ